MYRQKRGVLYLISLLFFVICALGNNKTTPLPPTMLPTRSCKLKFIKIKPLAVDGSKLSSQVHSTTICQNLHFIFHGSTAAECFCPTVFTDLFSKHPCYWAVLALWISSVLETLTYQVVPFVYHPNVSLLVSYILYAYVGQIRLRTVVVYIYLTLYALYIILQYVYKPTRCAKFLWLEFIFY